MNICMYVYVCLLLINICAFTHVKLSFKLFFLKDIKYKNGEILKMQLMENFLIRALIKSNHYPILKSLYNTIYK